MGLARERQNTKTIMGISTTRMLTTGYVPGMLKNGFTRDFLLDGVSSRYVPMYLHAEKGAVLKVPANTPYFSNVTQPKAVIDFRFVNPLSEYEPNENYNTIISGLSIIVEAGGNQGAIGVRLRGAQGSGLEDISITFRGNSGLAGVVGGCGSGGAHHQINVTGGRYGLDLRMSQPASTVSGITLTSQTCGAVVYRGFETLTVVGATISNFLGDIAVHAGYPNTDLEHKHVDDPCFLPTVEDDDQRTNGVIAGMMSWIDASFHFTETEGEKTVGGKTTTVFKTNRSLYLENVFVSQGVRNVAVFPTSVVPSPASFTVFLAASFIRVAPKFSTGSNRTTDSATVTPSFVMTGLPRASSYITHLPEAPRVDLTARANLSTPAIILLLASSPKLKSLMYALGWLYSI